MAEPTNKATDRNGADKTKLFPETRLEDIYGMAKYRGPKRSQEEMDAAVLAEAAKRYR